MNKMSKRTDDILIEKVKRDINSEPQIAHFHPYYEIGYLVNGTRRMTIDHSIYYMEKGDIVLVDKEAVHKGSMTSNNGDALEWMGLYFAENYLEPFVNAIGKSELESCFNSGVVKIPSGRREYVEELLKKMIHENSKIDELSELLVRNYFCELMSFIIRCKNGTTTQAKKLNPEDELIADAAHYIYTNYNKDITLDSIADKYNISKSHFSKKFKGVTGCGFKEYLTSVRLKEACNRIINTKDSITKIAIDCGFSDSNYFGDAFRKAKGVSPNQYRKNNGLI